MAKKPVKRHTKMASLTHDSDSTPCPTCLGTGFMTDSLMSNSTMSKVMKNQFTQTTVELNNKEKSDSSIRYDHAHTKFCLNILILGAIGSGKATLANKMTKQEIFALKDDLMRKPEIRWGVSISDNFNFLLIDTFGTFNADEYEEMYSYSNIQGEIERHMCDGVNLIIFTLRNGSSSDELKVLKYIIEKRFSKNVNEHVALVFTACDEIGLSRKEEFLRNMRDASEDAKFVYDYASMQKGVKVVSFPNIDEIEDISYKVLLQEKVKASEKELAHLLKDCKTQLYFKQIFLDVTEDEKTKWSLVPPKRASPTCIQS